MQPTNFELNKQSKKWYATWYSHNVLLSHRIAITSRQDIVIRYSSDVDVVKVYMTRATPNLIEESISLDFKSIIFMDVDKASRIVAIEFLIASKVFPCHFFDSPLPLDGKAYA